MKQLNDIETLEDVKTLVNTFYAKVREDDLLKDIFNNVIDNRWTEHLEKLSRFWQTVLLEEHTYYGSPFLPHAKLPVDKAHFTQWLHLFHSTIDELFCGKNADRAKWQSERMAEMFLSKIQYYNNNSSTPLL